MVRKAYFPRIADAELKELLSSSGAVLIEGAKWCGKTRMAHEMSRSALFMQDPDRSKDYLQWANNRPSILLQGETPRLIDEWQIAPVLWDAVRFAIDQRAERGQFILTGSAVPAEGATMHTGTGRIARLRLRPMSLFESKESCGSVSLKALFDGQTEVEGTSALDIPDLAQAICRGGWPEAVVSNDRSNSVAKNYTEAITRIDIQRLDGVERDSHRAHRLLHSYARNLSTLASLNTIQVDVTGSEVSIKDSTLYSYINAFRKIFVIEDVPAWLPRIQSKTAMRASEKRQLTDPSIATAILRIRPEKLLEDFTYFGFLFESLCTRDMRVYAQANDGQVFHYHDRNDLEADMIVELADGRWAAIEVKLGSSEIDEAAANLLKLAEKVDKGIMGNPSFLMVLTGGSIAYRRKDGVLVVPVGCMKQ